MSKISAPTEQPLDVLLSKFQAKNRLESWSAFVNELQVPADLMPAIVTMRPEMIRLAPRRDISADEVKTLYELIAGLIETNVALQSHAKSLADLVTALRNHNKGTDAMLLKLENFANFRRSGADCEDG